MASLASPVPPATPAAAEKASPPPMDSAAKIAAARALKSEGNAHFKAGSYSKAKKAYSKVFLYVEGLHGPNSSMAQYQSGNTSIALTTEQEADVRVLKRSVWLNLSMALIKLEKPRAAMGYCEKVLADDPTSVKALYRRGVCQMMLGDLDAAKGAFEAVAARDPNDKAVQRSLVQLGKAYKKCEAAERKKYANAFGGAADGATA